MAKRKRSVNRKSRASACFDRRLLKNKKMKNLCRILSKKNCLKSNGASKSGKRCRKIVWQSI